MRVIEYKDNVELTKALMMVLESSEAEDGQIIFHSNCYWSENEFLDENGCVRGITFGIEEFADE